MIPWNKTSVNFLEGELILIDKPLNWTSFDVVKKLRYEIRKKIGVKKIKVGHAGTLDPLATGLLIICTGKNTKRIEELMGLVKVYTGVIKVGGTTPSYDLETDVDQTFDTDHINDSLLQKASENLTGILDQVPPIFSAKKVDGKRAYELARSGEKVELRSNQIEVKEFKIATSNFPEVSFNVTCSKGTYIRSLARDFGLELNSGAHLTSLRREAIGSYNLKKALSPDDFCSFLKNAQ